LLYLVLISSAQLPMRFTPTSKLLLFPAEAKDLAFQVGLLSSLRNFCLQWLQDWSSSFYWSSLCI